MHPDAQTSKAFMVRKDKQLRANKRIYGAQKEAQSAVD